MTFNHPRPRNQYFVYCEKFSLIPLRNACRLYISTIIKKMSRNVSVSVGRTVTTGLPTSGKTYVSDDSIVDDSFCLPFLCAPICASSQAGFRSRQYNSRALTDQRRYQHRQIWQQQRRCQTSVMQSIAGLSFCFCLPILNANCSSFAKT